MSSTDSSGATGAGGAAAYYLCNVCVCVAGKAEVHRQSPPLLGGKGRGEVGRYNRDVQLPKEGNP